VAMAAVFLLAVAGGVTWFQVSGKDRIEAAREAREAALRGQAQALRALERRLEAAREEHAEAERLRAARREHGAYLDGRIEEAREALRARREQEAPLLAQVDLLGARLNEQRRERSRRSTVLHDLEDRLAAERKAARTLEQRAGEGGDRLRDARRPRGEKPTLFPARSAAASLLERRAGRSTYLLTVSRDLMRAGPGTLGLLGSVGLAGEGTGALVETGLYLSAPLKGRRAAADLTAGLGRRHALEDTPSVTAPFVGLLLRWAPIRGERAWLVAGLHHSDAETALRFGASLGR